MNLELTKSIIIEEVKGVKYAGEFLDEGGEVINWCNGNNLMEALYGYEGGVIHKVDQQGGEGEGDHYHIVFKINHPEYGIGYIKFAGHYDSWNGTDWYNEPTMCQPVEVTIIEYQDL